MRTRSMAGPVLVLATVALPAAGQQRFRVGVDVLHIQVSVADAEGAFVPGLAADDFVLRVDGEVRPIVTAYSIDSDRPHASWLNETSASETNAEVAPGAASVRAMDTLPAAARRRFVFFIDLARMSRIGLRNIRRTTADFLERHVRPADLLAVVVYSPLQGLEYLIPFTTNHDQVADVMAGIASARATEAVDDAVEGIPIDELVQFYAAQTGDLAVTDFIREIEETRFESQVESMFDALTDLADSLRSTEGRKYVLMFAHGMPNSVLADPGILGTLDEFTATARRSDVVFYTFEPSNVQTNMVHDASEMQPRDRGQTSPWDPPGTFVIRDRGVLHFLADETGGDASFWRWAVKKGLEEVERVTNDYYLLAFPLRASDGETIAIDVEAVSPEVEVVWAPTELAVGGDNEVPTEFQRHFDVAQALEMGANRNDLGAAAGAWLLPPSRERRSRVAVAVEVGAEMLDELRLSNAEGLAEFELLGLTVTAGRNVIDYFRSSARADLSSAPADAPLSPFRFSSWLQVPPGRHYVKILVRESVSGRIFSRSMAVSVPEEPERELRLETPLLVLPPGSARILRGVPSSGIDAAARGEPVEDPFNVNGALVIPELADATAPGAQVAFLVTAHGVGAHPDSGQPRLSLSAHLSDAPGRHRPLAGLSVVRSEWEADAGLLRVIARVRLPDDLRSGAHTLRLLAADGVAGSDASAELRLVVLDR